jgi:hypothetical protein
MLRNRAEIEASATCSELRTISDATSITRVLPLSRSGLRIEMYGVVSAASKAQL